MSKNMISIGSVIDYPTVHLKKVTGKVELILDNTVIIRDLSENTHLVLKSSIEENGFCVDEKTYVTKTRYSKK